MKPMRKKVHREWLENQLARYERRIQKFASIAYSFRQAIETLDRQEAARNKEKGELNNAIHQTGIEAGSGIGKTDLVGRELELLNNDTPKEILGEQPTELSVD